MVVQGSRGGSRRSYFVLLCNVFCRDSHMPTAYPALCVGIRTKSHECQRICTNRPHASRFSANLRRVASNSLSLRSKRHILVIRGANSSFRRVRLHRSYFEPLVRQKQKSTTRVLQSRQSRAWNRSQSERMESASYCGMESRPKSKKCKLSLDAIRSRAAIPYNSLCELMPYQALRSWINKKTNRSLFILVELA